ncbi:MAG: DUF4145 domain-containing protein [Candidatus Buchananbacteria bacterium]
MFDSKLAQNKYIVENYQEITDSRIDDDHWDIPCTRCKVVRGFVVTEKSRSYDSTKYDSQISLSHPYTMTFHCPVCKLFKLWVVFKLDFIETREDGEKYNVKKYYKVTSLPGEGIEDIDELPVEPPSLRVAYKQAIRAMDANAYIAAAAMFRRALQIITRDILGVTPGNLGTELMEAVGKKYNGATITTDFSDIGYIIKEAGNQGAHPDQDSDLLDFSPEDAYDLQKIFMELVSDLFVVPVANKKTREDFLKRRKIQ